MSWISDTLRGAMAERPPSDLRLSVSWIRPADEIKENLELGSSKIAFPFLRWTGFIIYLEVPNCLELNFSLCFLDNAEGGTTARIYPAQTTKSIWIEDHMKRLLCWFNRLPFLTCLTCSPWLQILSSRSQRLAIRVFSSTPVMLTSPWPNSTASRPIFSTSIRLVCT